jgi:hypothetical protein
MLINKILSGESLFLRENGKDKTITVLDNNGWLQTEGTRKKKEQRINGTKSRFYSLAGSRYFCESLFWASQPKQAAKT